jgi:amidase
MKRRISRRDLLHAALALPLGSFATGCRPGPTRSLAAGPLADLDAVATAAAIRSGELGVAEAVEAAIARAQALEPALNAIVTADYERARASAAAAPAGPFTGVPTFIKDLDDVRHLPTRFGSRSFGQAPAAGQSPFVDALERSGLVFLGKSSTPEFGLTGSTEPLLHGPTRNPWNLEYSPGGSSGGAAALVAARVVPIAHATDGGGSIRIPASCCGLFGLKPSRGRTVSMGRPAGPVEIGVGHAVSISVRDGAQWLATTERTGADRVFEPVGLVGTPSSRRLRIALDLEPLAGNALEPAVRAAILDTARQCEALGHRVEQTPLPVPKRELLHAFMLYWASGAAMVADGLEKRLGRPLTDADLEPWTLGLRDYYRERREQLEASVALIRSTSALCESFHERFDLLLTPVATRLPFRIGELAPDLPFETHFERATDYVGFTPIQNGAGTPGMSVPLHWSTSGLPIGSHFAAKAGDERTLLELALELEAAHPWADRRPPIAVA